MGTVFLLMIFVGVIFGSLGALSAYLITYKEWEHHYSTPKIPRKMALETALFTFLFFMGLMLVVGFIFR